MAKALVENLASEWKPDQYADDYRQNLMRVIKAKLKGKQANLIADEHPRASNVVDLMERLRRVWKPPQNARRPPGAGDTP